MNEDLYNALGFKKNKILHHKKELDLLSLKDYLERKITIKNTNELKSIIVSELKSLLNKENPYDLIDGLFELELQLATLMDFSDDLVDIEAVEKIYRNFSPIYLRALLDNKDRGFNVNEFVHTLKSALSLSIESELLELETYGDKDE